MFPSSSEKCLKVFSSVLFNAQLSLCSCCAGSLQQRSCHVIQITLFKTPPVSWCCQILHGCLLVQTGTKELWKTLHFPACPGAGHACDVTTSIYTATGKHFFLHCYIVTTGAGAKRLRKGVFSSERLQRLDTSRGGGKDIKAKQSAFNARRQRSKRSPNRTRPGEKRDKTQHRCQRISPSRALQGLHREDKTFRLFALFMLHREKKKCRGGTNRS